jgi:hypothetical protein
MLIRNFALPAVIVASGLMALGAVSAQATTAIRTDPGGALLSGTTTLKNTSSTPAILVMTGIGTVSCAQTTVVGNAKTNTSATTITGTGQGTYTSCTDTFPVIDIESCRGHGTFPSITITSTATGGLIRSGDAMSRCAVTGTSTGACYYTAATATGVANNAASTITYANVPVTSVTTSGSLGALCGSTGSYSSKLTHGVNQSNQTLTITTS